MNITEWNDTWQRIKDRFPNWQPTPTEAEDWCMGLKIYDAKMVESVGHAISKKYSSEKPRLAWYIKECERRRKKERIENTPTFHEGNENDFQEYLKRREFIIKKLESVPIEKLREVTISVLKEHGHLISKPTSGNPREWKQTLRSLVFGKIFGKKEQT